MCSNGSRQRLSLSVPALGWLHRQAHGRDSRTASVMRASRYSFLWTRILVGVCRRVANHLLFAIFESAAEVRVLLSTGMTRLQKPSAHSTTRFGHSRLAGAGKLPSPRRERSIRLMEEQFIHFPVRAQMELHPEALKLIRFGFGRDGVCRLVGSQASASVVHRCPARQIRS